MMLGLGTLRVIPNWCNWPVVGGVSDVMGVEACKPYTPAEIESDFQVGLATACKNAADPVTCAAQNRMLYDAQLVAAAHSAPEAEQGTCEYEASQEYPTITKWFGPGLVCKMRGGGYTTYILIAVAAVALLMLPRGGRRR